MVRAVSLETSGNNADESSYTTGNIHPKPDTLVLAWVHSTASTTPNTPTLSGNGLTWVQVATVTDTATRRLSVFRASGNATGGVLTLDFGGQTQTGCVWSIVQYPGAKKGGIHGSAAIVQSATNYDATNSSSLTVELASSFSTGNDNVGAAAFAYPLNNGNGTAALDAIDVSEHYQTTPDQAILTTLQRGEDTMMSASWSPSSVTSTGIALEIAAEPVKRSKSFDYKVYDASGNYIANWTDEVINEPSFAQEINTPASELVIRLARPADDFGEEADVKFKNIVKVYVEDDDPNTPALLFQGYIANYMPHFGNNEYIEVIVYSFGTELDSQILTTDETADQSQASGSSTESFGNGKALAQSFVANNTVLSAVEVKLSAAIPTTVSLVIQTDNGNEPSGVPVTNGSATKQITDTTATVQRFFFGTPPSLTVGATYWIVLS